MKKFFEDLRTDEFQIIVRGDHMKVLSNLDVLGVFVLEHIAIRYQEFMMKCGYNCPTFPLRDYTITDGFSVRKDGLSVYMERVDDTVVFHVEIMALKPSNENDRENFNLINFD